MDTLIALMLIQFIIVFVTDYSGFPQEGIKPLFNKLFGIGKPSKIFVCSLCQTTWVGLAYLIITGTFTLPYFAFNMLLAALTPVTYLLICLARDILETTIGWIYKLLGM